MQLPTLYKINKNGSIQVCNILITDNVVTTTFGQLDGKMQTRIDTCKGKNSGRANATTDAEQATKEAQAKWDRKCKDGYSTDKSAPTTTRVQAMKVKKLQDQEKNVVYPCISTPKLNGICTIYKLEDGVLNLYSRTGELFPPVPHQEADVLVIMAQLHSTELNGEQYIHGEHLQDIQSAVTKTNPLSTKLEFAIFAICDSGLTYEEDRTNLMKVEKQVDFNYVAFLTGIECANREEVETHYNQCMANNLEGTVIKNLAGKYEHGKRSSHCFKYKKTLDSEHKVIGYEIDKNDCPVWILEASNGTPFKAKPKGERPEQQAIALTADNYIGKYLNIEYETLSRDGIPLKPIGQYFRGCDTNGQPLI